LSSCIQCSNAGIDHDDIVRECLTSPLNAGRILAGFDWFANPLHQAIDTWHMRKLDEGCRRVLILLPRGHMKTFYFGISTMLWRTLRNIEDRVLYVMSSCTESAKTLSSIAEIYKNSDALRHFFPGHVLDTSNTRMRSTTDYIRLNRKGNYREGTLEARGIDSRITGGHFTHHIFDDLIDEKMVDSEPLQGAAINFVKRADPLFVNPGQDTRTIIGTRWPGSFYNWLLEPGGIADSYEKLILGCYVDYRFRQFLADIGKKTLLEDGEPIWERFTTDTLEDIRKVSTFDFSHQYLNIEVSDSDRRFRKEDIMYYNYGVDKGRPVLIGKTGAGSGDTFNVPLSRLHVTMTIDPATGEHNKTDESAITVCGHDPKTGVVFVLDAWAGRALPFDLIDKIFEMAVEHNPRVVAPEDVAFQKTLKHFLRRQMIERGIHFPIRPVKPGTKSKGARIIDALQPFVQNQQVYFLRNQKKLVDELLNLQIINGRVIGKSPNLADSLAYHAEFWRGGPVFQAEPEDDYDTPFMLESGPAYGLCCLT
jgi:predicted phage terminase large subunit-like protein